MSESTKSFKFYFGHNIPKKNLQVYKVQESGESVLIQNFDSQLCVSKAEFKNFLRQFDFLIGYTLLQGDGMYMGEEEESSQLEVFGITDEQASLLASTYISKYLQDDVYFSEV